MITTAVKPAHLVCLFSVTAIKCFFLFCNAPTIDNEINANAKIAIQLAIRSENDRSCAI
jgi:hypothetical protein